MAAHRKDHKPSGFEQHRLTILRLWRSEVLPARCWLRGIILNKNLSMMVLGVAAEKPCRGHRSQHSGWEMECGVSLEKKGGAEAGRCSEDLVDLETLQTGSIDPLNLDGEKTISLFSLTFNCIVGCPSATDVGDKAPCSVFSGPWHQERSQTLYVTFPLLQLSHKVRLLLIATFQS